MTRDGAVPRDLGSFRGVVSVGHCAVDSRGHFAAGRCGFGVRAARYTLGVGLQGFERRLERLVEGTFNKAFRSGLQPVEIGHRMTRTIDLGRTLGVNGRPVAPNNVGVYLAPGDFERFQSFAEALARGLAVTCTIENPTMCS